MESKPVSKVPPQSLLQFLQPGSGLSSFLDISIVCCDIIVKVK
ncbi:rCG49996 [Rattus norvegicus]|uniref:RCG49996 n=1 Tax=Rattus norvegicus TaxID=10116 RepID=A6JVF8_RAT|nr:rCG49996 [Rattus norvegicus]